MLGADMNALLLGPRRVLLPAALAVAALAFAGTASADPGRQQPAKGGQALQAGGFVGADTCLTCHEDKGESLSGTPHARAFDPRTPAASQSCESCHGPGQAHVDGGGDKGKITAFTTMAPREASAICTTCHNRAEHAEWDGSAHDSRNLSCVTCHSVHTPKSADAQLTKATQIETCGQCHRDKLAKLNRSAHMPVREGKLECSSCHNPHGSTNVRLLRVGTTVNESCVGCHSEKRGPYLWEHGAVRENCTTCHDPHGSTNDRMLVAKMPMLCQRCHVTTRHPPTVYEGSVVKTSNRLYGRSCVNCHSNIHGSNHPSGNAFLR